MKKISSAIIVLTLLLTTACKHSELPPDYVGTWNNGANKLILNRNNTYSFTSATYTASGTYAVSGTYFTFRDNSGVCSDSIPGVYNYTYYINSSTGTFYQQLNLSLITDICQARAAVLPGTYTVINK